MATIAWHPRQLPRVNDRTRSILALHRLLNLICIQVYCDRLRHLCVVSGRLILNIEDSNPSKSTCAISEQFGYKAFIGGIRRQGPEVAG